MRNLSSTLDIIMSHITHFYHLAALDYLDVTTAAAGVGGPSVVMSPWAPQHLNWDSIGDVQGVPLVNIVRDVLVGHYVQALQIRREAHIAAATIDGKHPIQNAQVPGGFTTKPSSVNWNTTPPNDVVSLVNSIRTFINTIYIPDVLAAALCFGTAGLIPVGTVGVWPLPNQPNLFLQGYGCGNLLAYGAFPVPANGNIPLFLGGTVSIAAPPLGPITTAPAAVVEADISEDTTSGFYSSPSGLHPSVGQTTPDMTGGGYTWHKAPRYLKAGVPSPYEVGPLARMVVSTALANPTTVTDADIPQIPGDTLSVAAGLGPFFGPFGALTYNIKILVDAVLTTTQALIDAVSGNPPIWLPGVPDYSLLMSILGRHAARALECKYLADALAGNWPGGVGPAVYGPGGPTGAAAGAGVTPGIPMINSVVLDPAAGSEVYAYQVMPKSLKMGKGMTEAPRGALGHWITSEFRRIVNYQCVVPSTWNACGRDILGTMGPIEQSLFGLTTGYVGDGLGTTPDVMINRLLRAIHPFDICVACSVHVTDTKGETITKFRMDPDGKVTKEEVPAEA